ncbi:trypsin-like peptidase domain-containing protein [Cellulomonas fimi]|uniref:S1C family serine protease n=1 Tax=Cellulomonas fimi TaxID=1708 RepID=UPI00234CF3D0|nr:trypsin-like peptidase domain-containing protein [Cellulomonas fimi]MDC7119956.1 trypsin-like peptidase domain-containing protein [Cellulomonas fimi]
MTTPDEASRPTEPAAAPGATPRPADAPTERSASPAAPAEHVTPAPASRPTTPAAAETFENPFASPSGRRVLPPDPAPRVEPGTPAGDRPAPSTPHGAGPAYPDHGTPQQVRASDPRVAQPRHGGDPRFEQPGPGGDPRFAQPGPGGDPRFARRHAGPDVAAHGSGLPAGQYRVLPPGQTADGAPPFGAPTRTDGPDGTAHLPVLAAPRRRRRTLSAAWVVPLVVLALVAGVVGGVLGARFGDDDRLADAGLPTTVPGAADVARAPESVAGIAATVLPSVVSIEVDGPQGTATGSGFVLRADGYLVTNNHVVAEAANAATSMVVTFADGSEESATVVGRTSEYDLAVLKVDVTGLTPLLLGDSDAVVVGDPVVAIGAPLGLAGTVTTGIVSALNRPVSAGDEEDTAFINAIQTDAAINPGNSGGPLVNAKGEVIGVNSAIAQPPGTPSTSGGSIGLGFAIPSEQVRRTAEQLIETGRATYPIIGVLLDQRYVGEGVQVSTEDRDGTPAVSPEGPAERAGIRRGDVILAIDGRPVTDPDELIVAIRARTPGETVVLRVRTGSDERDVRVRLDEADAR